MAVDFKEIVISGLLDLCETIPLSKITVKDILSKTGVSKQSFYNHFQDKYDLIIYVYLTKMIPDFVIGRSDLDYYNSVKADFERFSRYHKFLKQALMMEGQNSLSDFMVDYCVRFDMEMLKKAHGDKELTEEQVFASKYHSIAAITMAKMWIVSDMPVPPEKMAEQLTLLRRSGLGVLYDKSDELYSIDLK